VGDDVLYKMGCGRLVLDKSVVLGVDPEKLMVRDGNGGGNGGGEVSGADGEGSGVARDGGAGSVCDAKAKR
jgi:hypothetical protein